MSFSPPSIVRLQFTLSIITKPYGKWWWELYFNIIWRNTDTPPTPGIKAKALPTLNPMVPSVRYVRGEWRKQRSTWDSLLLLTATFCPTFKEPPSLLPPPLFFLPAYTFQLCIAVVTWSPHLGLRSTLLLFHFWRHFPVDILVGWCYRWRRRDILEMKIYLLLPGKTSRDTIDCRFVPFSLLCSIFWCHVTDYQKLCLLNSFFFSKGKNQR